MENELRRSLPCQLVLHLGASALTDTTLLAEARVTIPALDFQFEVDMQLNKAVLSASFVPEDTLVRAGVEALSLGLGTCMRAASSKLGLDRAGESLAFLPRAQTASPAPPPPEVGALLDELARAKAELAVLQQAHDALVLHKMGISPC